MGREKRTSTKCVCQLGRKEEDHHPREDEGLVTAMRYVEIVSLPSAFEIPGTLG